MGTHIGTPRIVVVGSANIDFIMKMERLPRVGESVTSGTFDRAFGGKGANQAVAAARAAGAGGPGVALVASLGGEPYADDMIASWKEAGLDVSAVIRADTYTGTALIMIGEAGRNYISVAPGANDTVTPERIDAVAHLIAGADYVLTQFEIPEQTLEHLLKTAAAAGVPVVWNVAPMRAVRRDLVGTADTVVVNETEAESITGLAVGDLPSAVAAARSIRDLGARAAIITLGAEGSVVADPDGDAHVKAFPVDAVDTTAAGDTYCGCLVTALAEGRAMPDAVRFASAAAAISVGRLGAQPSIPRRGEIDEFLQRHADGR